MKNLHFLIIIGAMVLISGLGCSISVVRTLDDEARMRNRIFAQQNVVEANFDKMWKVIEQQTQVAQASKDLQLELVESLVKGRSASFIKIVNESNPESAFTREQFTQLSNSIETQREEFLAEQTKLFDFVRYQHTLFDETFSGAVLSITNREKLPITVISSTKTKRVIESGIEDFKE